MSHPMPGYPPAFLAALWWILGLLGLSGLLLLPGALELRLGWELPALLVWKLPGGRIGIGAAHAAFAFISSSLLGALAPLHMRAGWKRRENRISGCIMLGSFIVLLLSALGIYYIADEDLGNLSSLVHWVLGLLLLLPLGLHALLGRRTYRRRQRRREQLGQH